MVTFMTVNFQCCWIFQDILTHPWFKEQLPAGADGLNQELIAQSKHVEEGVNLQSDAEILELVRKAKQIHMQVQLRRSRWHKFMNMLRKHLPFLDF